MKPSLFSIFSIALVAITILSCTCVEDPGPLIEETKSYSIIEFDQLEIGDAFNIQVEQSEVYEITVRGDARNLNDLNVAKTGNTLVMGFKEDSGRKHQTFITIKMPELQSVHFSGASISTISGFNSEDELDFYLSGASLSQLSAGYRAVNITLSGASILKLRGLGDDINADISGASQLIAFDYPVSNASVNLTGASSAKVKVSEEIEVTASGASVLFYSGNPIVHQVVSGGSSVSPY